MKTLLMLIAAMLFAATSHAAFTVDERSGLHLGASFAIGATLDALALAATPEDREYPDRWKRRTFLMAACLAPGLAKELSDSEFDSGDMAFNGLGCVAGISLSEGLALTVTDKTVAVVGTW